MIKFNNSYDDSDISLGLKFDSDNNDDVKQTNQNIKLELTQSHSSYNNPF